MGLQSDVNMVVMRRLLNPVTQRLEWAFYAGQATWTFDSTAAKLYRWRMVAFADRVAAKFPGSRVTKAPSEMKVVR